MGWDTASAETNWFNQRVEHIVTGKPVNAKKALKLGLADAMVPSAFKHDALMGLIKAKKLKRKKPAKQFVERVPEVWLASKAKSKAIHLTKNKWALPSPIKSLGC